MLHIICINFFVVFWWDFESRRGRLWGGSDPPTPGNYEDFVPIEIIGEYCNIKRWGHLKKMRTFKILLQNLLFTVVNIINNLFCRLLKHAIKLRWWLITIWVIESDGFCWCICWGHWGFPRRFQDWLPSFLIGQWFRFRTGFQIEHDRFSSTVEFYRFVIFISYFFRF